MRLHQAHEREQLESRVFRSRQYMRSFKTISDHWALSRKEINQLLGLTGLYMIGNWQSNLQDTVLTAPQLEKLSFLLVIHKLLVDLLPRDTDLQSWLRTSNDYLLFGGKAPLDAMYGADKRCLQAVSEWLLNVDEDDFSHM